MIKPKLSNAYTCPYCNSQDIVTEYHLKTGTLKVVCRSCHRYENVHQTDEGEENGIHET